MISFTLCACVSEGVGVCQMVKMAVRMWSGRVPLDRRDSGFAHKMTGRQKKECVRVCVCVCGCVIAKKRRKVRIIICT